MLNNQSDSPTDLGDSTFSASDYFLGIAQRVIAAGTNTRISLPQKGEVVLYPGKNMYTENVADMPEFCSAPANQFQTSPLSQEEQPQKSGKNIRDLLWQAAYYASKGRLIDGCSNFDVVQFRNWPNLAKLPHNGNTMRICALLTRYPTTIMLVPRRLQANKEEVFQTYSAAYCAGLVKMISQNPQSTATEAEDTHEEPIQEHGLLRSLFAKISGL